ncbi:putative Glycoside hydrolase/deacetylase, beta/alpha-barrel, Polysaccharide deacetylase protein [Trachipleistophora hominis]|uniref:Putative Glycoside hydrolase/deacetylase, beta/alpha-barrel, Polysaccharide deacetylase protein n=1 Tax=Trachipleistophora hominis TaxID=72359 RepID=L7JUB5_TRAHO|nr:putative Glycoside hydrolase/deacetylase, beta/alpha-barrel, Polysaccharide deacetylase protein [Trachipleistophora hominis]
MILFLFERITAITVATISFDEGPSQHTDQLLQYLRYYNLPVCFHVDPYKINDKDLITRMAEHHEIGLAITEEIKSEHDIDRYIRKFKRTTGLVPRFVRLPRFGWPDFAPKYCQQKNLIVTTPSLDTEDIELPNFIDFLVPTLLTLSETNDGLSLVLRDRFRYSVESIGIILHVLFHKNIKLLSFTRFYAVDPKMEQARDEDIDEESDHDESNGTEKGVVIEEEPTDEQEMINEVDRKVEYKVERDDDKNLENGVTPDKKEENKHGVLIEDIGDEDAISHGRKEERSSGGDAVSNNPRISTFKINYDTIKDIKGLEESLKKLRNFDIKGNRVNRTNTVHKDHSYTSSLRMPYNENNTKVFALEYKVEEDNDNLDVRKKFEEEGSGFKRSTKSDKDKDEIKESKIKDTNEKKEESTKKEKDDNDTKAKEITKTQSNGCMNTLFVTGSIAWCTVLILFGSLV